MALTVTVRKRNGRLERWDSVQALVIRDDTIYLNPLPQHRAEGPTGLIIYRPGSALQMRVDLPSGPAGEEGKG